jgi:hypothetical protein
MTFIAFLFPALLLVADPPRSQQVEWKVLFDGTSTDAWRGYNRVGFPAECWAVVSGTLEARKATGGCDLMTREKYGDFELELQFKVGKGGNSGILYRAAELPAPAPIWHSAPEYQILDDAAHADAAPSNLTGGLYDLVAPRDKVLKPLGEWNDARVRVQGNRVEHWLNGTKILDYELGSAALAALIAKSKFKDMPRFARETEGHVSLQHHGENAWFRNVRIRPLTAGSRP